MSEHSTTPAVSIILPTYNRSKFLPQAFEAIRGQQFQDWELIIVDDGSTDNTRELVAEQTRGWEQPVRYVYQENQGAYGARNTGLGLAEGRYIAFYDSDDIWLPHHLKNCVEAMEAHPMIDWAYAACRVVDQASGRIVEPSTFYIGGRPRPFLSLAVRRSGGFMIFEDSRIVKCILEHGLYCGLQVSVIRRRVFDKLRFDVRHRNEGEDVLFAFRALVRGYSFGYLINVHVIYTIHGQNSSAVEGSVEKKLEVQRGILKGLEDALVETPLPAAERRLLRRTLSRVYFWHVGNALLWQHGRRREAIGMYRRGLQTYPWSLAYWKTYAASCLKVWISGRVARSE